MYRTNYVQTMYTVITERKIVIGDELGLCVELNWLAQQIMFLSVYFSLSFSACLSVCLSLCLKTKQPLKWLTYQRLCLEES